MAIDESSTEQSRRISLREKLAFLFDYVLLMGVFATVTGAVSRTAGWTPFAHLLLPLLGLPVLRWLYFRFVGTTPGQLVTGLMIQLPAGSGTPRLYDWLFVLRPRKTDKPLGKADLIVAILAGIIFTLGADFFLWMRDPTLRPLPVITLPIFAPDVKETSAWQVIPFFYATGAFPVRMKDDLSVEFSLPYEKGPPHRFLGKINVYWREFDSRLTLTGPLSVASPATPQALEQCFRGWFRCLVDRRKIWGNSIAPQIGDRLLAENAWFTTENPFLARDERPQGIYLKTTPDRGRIREAYIIVGPKMAIQSFILDRPDRPEGVTASDTLRKIIGSLRISGDLAAPRAFINPKLAALRVGPKSKLSELVAAESYLLAKVSIEPKQIESFYHLGGLALTLYRAAKREGRIELAASSKTIVQSALKFARDITPDSKLVSEMEKFEAEVEAK